MTLSVQELSDREEIRETIMRWSRAMDSFDWELLQTAYTTDLQAGFSAVGIPRGSAEDTLKFLQRSQPFFHSIQHVLSNLTFHEVTRDRARTSTLYFATVIPKGADLFHDGGWYH